METYRRNIVLALGLALGATGAIAQTSPAEPAQEAPASAPPTANPPQEAEAGPAAGVPPAAPPVQVAPAPATENDPAGQPGFFRPSEADAVVVPGFMPSTPGVTPIDTTTNATVGSSSSDRALRDEIASVLANDPSLQGARINVTVSDGAVTLAGTATDAAQAERARAVVEGVAGASRVASRITTD